MRNKPFKINQYQVTPAEFSIQADGFDKQSLQPKFIEVLFYLAEHHGRVVPRDELIDHIWGQDSYVGEKSLTNAIWHLRKKLSCADDEEIIKTIRKAGYQLMPEPQWQVSPELLASSINYSVDSAIENSADIPVYQTQSIVSNPQAVNSAEHTANKSKVFNISSTHVLVTLILSLLVLLYIQQFSDDDDIKITAITKHPGSELFPSPSPDGRFLVYSQVSTNKPTNLFMKDTHQVELPPKQLTFDNAIEMHSVWSNNGQYLYFARKDKANNSCYYIQLKVSSQQETQLATCPMQGVYYYLDISPDDQTLAVYNKGVFAKRTGIYFIDLSSKNFAMTRFSCDSDCTYKDRDMSFSSNGKYMAVSRRINRLSENIYLINLATKETEQLTYDEEDIVGMSWLGDSQKLVFAAQRADNRFGFVIDIQSRVKQALNLTGFSYPSIAKESQQLYYQERIESSSLSSLQLNDAIASSPFPVLQSNFTYESPDYSAINDLVVFSSNESGFDELWSAKPDGSARKQLTNLKQTLRYPKWSHNGEMVAFLAPLSEDRGDGIYIYSMKNERVTLLKSPFNQHNRPNWSMDDNQIISAIYGNHHTDIYSISISDASTKRLTVDGGRYGVMISADTLLYTKLKKGLWQKNINDVQAGHRVIKGSIFNTLYAWTYEKGHVYYQKTFDDHYQLISYDIEEKIKTPLVRLPLNSISKNDSLTYVATKDRLLYTSSSFPQANINMVASKKLF
ncbi:MAG: winged helix-turn-helix domain-containing protein [Colwellia sp.]|uniref:winged helix-turn-helix domain-containing protein n=1 Tax=Colwellia sp. TaxID=56799 RepID=UPI0025BAD22E|nr:winged helix-turn-helix domain-containing protein [Colwellia sp.]NQZ26186.1 winged helix-turn-helix domain-containing protein [Colwellia sp.]